MVVAVSKDTLYESNVRHGAGMLQLRRLAWQQRLNLSDFRVQSDPPFFVFWCTPAAHQRPTLIGMDVLECMMTPNTPATWRDCPAWSVSSDIPKGHRDPTASASLSSGARTGRAADEEFF